ncbi:MAG: CHASE domain-containing protein [Candidatus Kapaibacteriales bacterium]
MVKTKKSSKEIDITTYENILRQANQRKKGIFSLSRSYPAFIVFTVMLALSFFIYYNFSQQVKRERELAFVKATNSVLTRFQIYYNSHIQIATSIRSLYDNIVQVVRDYLLLYATMPVRTYPSILGFMSVQKVPKYRLTEFTYYVQGQGYYDYKVFPFINKDIFYPIEFIIPEEANKRFRGLDISSIPGIYFWFKKAIEEGNPIATKVFNFRGNDTLSLFLIYPVYDKTFEINDAKNRQEAFKSAVLMEINVPQFFKLALGSGVPSDTTIIFQCYQVEEDQTKTPLFSSQNYSLLKSGFIPILKQTTEFSFLDKKIYINFLSIPDFGGTFQRYLPTIALGVSILLSLIFFGFVLSVTTSRARAIDLAERMTRSQRRILESTKDIIAVLNFEGMWRTMNPASLNILGYLPEELIGKKIDILFSNAHDLNDFYSFVNNSTEEITRKIDYQMKTKPGELKWISWSFTFSPTDDLIYAIGRDITLEKLAEIDKAIKAKQSILAEQISREASEFKSYFMTKFTHQLRNMLTTISGYHQILAEKNYQNEDEMQTYLQMAINDTQELLSSTSDLFDVAGFGKDGSKILSTLNLYNLMNEALVIFQKKYPTKQVKILFDEGSQNSTIVSDREHLRNAFEKLFFALINGVDSIELNVQISDSVSEGFAEIQILATYVETVANLINLYNENINNLIEALRFDVDDILLDLSLFASMIRMLNGQVKFDSLGKDGNFVSIILPKRQ